MEKQQAGAAWGELVIRNSDAVLTNQSPTASRMGSVGHVLGYGAGALDLVSIFGKWMGDTQFKQLTIIATFSIITTSAVTCWAVTERVLVSKKEDGAKGGRFKVVRQIWSTLLHLPPRIQAICWAQFWSWIGL
jgi:solute carrier family 45 protein 1/2/4